MIKSHYGDDTYIPPRDDVMDLTSNFPEAIDRAGGLGVIGNSIDAALNKLGVVGDTAGDIIGGAFNAAGHIVEGTMKALHSITAGLGSAINNLSKGNIVGAIGSVAAGVVSAAGSVVAAAVGAVETAIKAVGSAIGSFFKGIGDAISSVFGSSSSSSSNDDGGGDSSGKPVIVDMDGDGIELTKLDESTTNFDFDDDGFLERTAWTTGDDALLVFDLNNDGRVTESKEIAFAKWTEEDDTDLEALAAHFDSNQDKVLDERDAGWNQFRLWQDRDSDGVVDDGEMVTLDEAGIKSIGLETRDGTGKVLSDGTVIHGLVDVQKSDGSITDGADVAFAYNSLGFRSYEDENGNLVYEFEDGDVQKIKKLGDGETDFNLGDDATVWIGAEGNALANVIDASNKTENVLLNGGAGNDTLIGGAGSDYLIGGEGTDALQGGGGSDILFVDGEDLSDPTGIDGGEGYDQIIMTDSTALDINVDEMSVEAVRSAGGDDKITGSKDDVNYAFAGGAGNDTLTGGGGHDLLSGEDGDDVLVGNGGRDRLFGEGGNDDLQGGEDEDFLAGGKGSDTLNGGAGNDIYYYNRGDGADTIHDYAEGTYQEEYSYEEQIAYQYNVKVRRKSGKRTRWVNETRTGYRMESRTGLRDVFGEIDGGIDTLQFGANIALADIVLYRSGNDMVVALRDKDDANVISGDSVTVTDWVDQKNRIENFSFSDGTKLDFSRIMHGQYGLGADDTLNGTNESDFLPAAMAMTR
jgi:Ca2+-binding RTX toxin-like protein